MDAAAAAMAAAAKINAELAKKAPVRQGEVPIIRQVQQEKTCTSIQTYS
jgi:serine protease inhibitor ecotin